MRKVVKGKLGEITFQLNPTTVTYDSGAVWAQINSPGMLNPISSFSYGKPQLFQFELWINKRHDTPVNVIDVFNKLENYRNGKVPVIFAYGTIVKKVIIVECPITIEALDSNLNPTELRIPLSLQVV